MGIPGFFTWIFKYVKNSISLKSTKQYDNIYVDMNSLLHTIANTVFNEKNLKEIKYDELEDIYYSEIKSHLNELINYNNCSLLYIAIDGVTVMPKIMQQRERRYNIKKIENDFYSSIFISPGTDFMKRLVSFLKKLITEITDENTKIKIILSSYDKPGEGEHKIMKYINENKRKHSNKKKIIYGTDADLILLSLININEHIFIDVMRDLSEIDKIILDTTENICYINTFYVATYIKNKNISIKDFIFLTFILGNDFVKNIPNLNNDLINFTNSIDRIIFYYVIFKL